MRSPHDVWPTRSAMHWAALALALTSSRCASDPPDANAPTTGAVQSIGGCDPAWADCAAREVVDLSAGSAHACALRIDGRVRCWGSNTSGQLGDGTAASRPLEVEVAGITTAAQISAGASHTCATLADGTVWCWGFNGSGQLGDGTLVRAPRAVRASGVSGASRVVTGLDFTCSLVAGGALRCWGANAYGQLGDGTVVTRLTSVPVPGLSGVVEVAAGGNHACALLGDGTVRCWGRNTYGQLGDGTLTDRRSPTVVPGLAGVARLAVGRFHTCAVLGTGAMRCWGRNTYGQLGDGTTVNRPSPVAVASVSGATRASGGDQHTCAVLTSGSTWCWGYNGDGQLGDGTLSNRASATRVVAADTDRVAASGSFSCALDTFGGVTCWGANASGQFGNDTTTASRTPARSYGAANALRFDPHSAWGCMVWFDRTVKCLTPSSIGGWLTPTEDGVSVTAAAPQYGASVAQTISGGGLTSGAWCARRVDGTVACSSGAALGLSGVTWLTGDASTPCVLRANGTVACWGSNLYGQVGDGTTTYQSTPRTIALWNVVALSASGEHACALTSDGSVWCWGHNRHGEIGDGTTTDRPRPTRVTTVSGATAVATSLTSTCVIAGAQVRCWGALSGPLPAVVSGVDAAVELAIGEAHGCARGLDGAVRCWGQNDYGQLGDGREGRGVVHPAGPAVPFLDRVAQLGVSRNSTCAVRADGSVRCWGRTHDNYVFRLGDGSAERRLRPVPTSRTAAAAAQVEASAHVRTVDGRVQLPADTAAGWAFVTGYDGVQEIAGGDNFLCARVGGTVRCSGTNTHGQLGDGGITSRTVPVPVTALSTAAAITAGSEHACARLSSGAVQCWGRNDLGQLGDSTTFDRVTRVSVVALSSVLEVHASAQDTCARLLDGGVRCWGGGYGRLPVMPAAMAGVSGTRMVRVGAGYACAVLADRTVRCWGPSAPTAGQLAGFTSVAKLSLGAEGQCAVHVDGTVSCRGAYAGTGTSDGLDAPALVPGLTGIVDLAIASVNRHYAVQADGRMLCWGQNVNFSLGDGSTRLTASPRPLVFR